MALLGEEVVEEWLNRLGYFTIRGIRLGVQEIDLLGIKQNASQGPECRHLEVQVSVNPVSYISRVPKAIQKATGKSANSAKRSEQELVDGVKEWLYKKFDQPRKLALMKSLCDGPWTRELVVHNVKSDHELSMIAQHDVRIHRLSDIVGDLRRRDSLITSASGGDLLELIHLTAVSSKKAGVRAEADIIAGDAKGRQS